MNEHLSTRDKLLLTLVCCEFAIGTNRFTDHPITLSSGRRTSETEIIKAAAGYALLAICAIDGVRPESYGAYAKTSAVPGYDRAVRMLDGPMIYDYRWLVYARTAYEYLDEAVQILPYNDRPHDLLDALEEISRI